MSISYPFNSKNKKNNTTTSSSGSSSGSAFGGGGSNKVVTSTFTMTQLPTPQRIYQRSSVVGGIGKGIGTIPVSLNVSKAGQVMARCRAVSDGTTILQTPWIAASVVISNGIVNINGINARTEQFYLDLSGDGVNWQNGTVPVFMGRLIALSGQNQAVRQIAKVSSYTGTMSSLNVTIDPSSRVYAAVDDTSVTIASASWNSPSDSGPYTSTFTAEFLRQQVNYYGVACGLVGYAKGDTAISDWASGSTPRNTLLAILDSVGGFEAFYWHQGGNDASLGTTKTAYKIALDNLFADITLHNATLGSGYTKVLTAMATRLAAGSGTTSQVQTIRQASKEWSITNNGIYLEPHDIVLEDSINQGQTGNIVLAQHVHRALSTNDVGPVMGTPTRAVGSAIISIPITFSNSASSLVITGNPTSRFFVYPTGTTTGALTISSVVWDNSSKRLNLTLSTTPVDTLAFDVYSFLHPDPSGTLAYSDMVRDDSGRSLEPTTLAPVVCAAAAIATAPSQMLAPTLSVNNAAISVTRAADPNDGGSTITGYDLRYSTDQITWTVVSMTSNPQTINGLTNDTVYYVQTRAKNAIGNGAYSASTQGTPTVALPDFTYDTNAQAWFTAVDAALTAAGQTNLTYAEKMIYNRLFVRIKATTGLYGQLYGMNLYGAMTYGVSARAITIGMIDMITPSRVSTITGTMSVTNGAGLTASNTTSYINTNIPANTIGSQDDWHLGILTYKLPNETWSASTVRSCGTLGASTVGISIRPYDTNTSKPAASGSGSAGTVSAVGYTDGGGFVVVSRSSSTQYVGYRNGTNATTVTETSTALPTGNIFVGACNNNGSATAASTQYRNAAFTCGKNLSAAQVKALYAAIKSTIDFFAFGLPTYYDPGTAPANVSADLVVYGLTSSGLAAAYEAARQGLNVVIVGGWRDHLGTIGGMMSNGLGFSDFDKPSSLAGLGKYHVYSANLKAGVTADTFEPRLSYFTFCEWLDSTRTVGKNIPIYFSTGVNSVVKSGTNITSIKTVDGRTFTAPYFVDCSYEGDLMAISGVTYIVGREDAGLNSETNNGWVGSTKYPTLQLNYSGTAIVVDPFVTAGDSASGKLNGIQDWPSTRVAGTGDWIQYNNKGIVAQNSNNYSPMTQSYNFRMTLTQSDVKKVIADWETTPPATYNAADFTVLTRLDSAVTAIGGTLTYTMLIKMDNLPSNSAIDANTNNGFSTDLLFGAWSYPEATYSQREVIWQNHTNWIQNLFYTHRNNTGLSSTIRTAALTYHLHNEHYLNPHPNDQVFWPCQLYVRESRRMVGDYIINANDLFQTDGTTPRSVKTIGAISYAIDSHQMGRYAYQRSGVWEVFMEGSFPALATGNTDLTTPFPYEAVLPKATECTNLAVTFCASCTHVAFGAVRMELTALGVGQAVGMAVAVAKQAGNIALKDVDYPTLRSRLLGVTLNTGETAPYLPQIN